jgi:hypothetical protein
MVIDHRRRGLVAARLNPEDDHQTEMARPRLARKLIRSGIPALGPGLHISGEPAAESCA